MLLNGILRLARHQQTAEREQNATSRKNRAMKEDLEVMRLA